MDSVVLARSATIFIGIAMRHKPGKDAVLSMENGQVMMRNQFKLVAIDLR